MLVEFDGLASPVSFTGCDEVWQGVTSILRGWRMRTRDHTPTAPPAIRLRKTSRGYLCVSPRLCKPSLCREQLRTEAVRAVSMVHSELIKQRLAEDPSLACLHCAALAFDQGLVLLTGSYYAGKSTLATHLAAAGHRLYCDDILPIEASRGLAIAPGFLPRLRLPLPAGLSPAFLDFLSGRVGLRGKRSQYVALRDDEIAPQGAMAPILGVVRIKRHEDGSPALVPTARSDTLQSLLRRNIARRLPALELLDRLHPIIESARCFTMHYAGCDEAVALLEEAFGAAPRRRAAA